MVESNTPYDDVYRTMYVESDELVLPLLNEVFHKHYTGTEKIIRRGNEHFENKEDGSEEKYITDSHLEVISETSEKYHMECDSGSDGSMIIRMFQYGSQLALEDAEIIDNTLHVNFPNAAVLFLRSTKKTPDQMKIHIHTPGGELAYDILTCKVKDYAIDDIFERKLYFLIPFYIFKEESKLKEYEADDGKLQELERMYTDIVKRLEQRAERGALSTFSMRLILDMTKKVAWHLAGKYDRVRKGIGDIMGGKVLDLEIIRIRNEERNAGRNEGIIEGRNEGIIEGKSEERNSIIRRMLENGLDEASISNFTGIPIEDIKKLEEIMV